MSNTGSIHTSMVIAAWITPLVLFASYFSSRRSRAPTQVERVLAKCWLAVRRTVCFTGAGLFGAAAVFGLYASFIEGSGLGLYGAVFCLLLAGVCTWWGVYGTGHRRTMGDDRSTHEERKRRYGLKSGRAIVFGVLRLSRRVREQNAGSPEDWLASRLSSLLTVSRPSSTVE